MSMERDKIVQDIISSLSSESSQTRYAKMVGLLSHHVKSIAFNTLLRLLREKTRHIDWHSPGLAAHMTSLLSMWANDHKVLIGKTSLLNTRRLIEWLDNCLACNVRYDCIFNLNWIANDQDESRHIVDGLESLESQRLNWEEVVMSLVKLNHVDTIEYVLNDRGKVKALVTSSGFSMVFCRAFEYKSFASAECIFRVIET
jgi:hypothetical protein